MRRRTALLVTLVLLAAACGGSEAGLPEGAFGIRASSDIGLGQERLLLAIGDEAGDRLGSPELAVTIEVAPEADPAATQAAAGIWTWIVPEATGLYRATFDFDVPGIWSATVVPQDGPSLEPVLFQVQERPFAPALGAPAPVAPTPTLDNLTIEELTTDPDPELSFYETSLEAALASGSSTVLVFSTPAYCKTAACGPLLDNVKAIVPDHPEVTFIHVEVFTDLLDPDFVPDATHLAPSAGPEWFALPSEPWVFVIDEAGNIAGRFEGVLDTGELASILP